MKFKSIDDALDECNVIVQLYPTEADALLQYTSALSFFEKYGRIERFDFEKMEIKFSFGWDAYFLSEAELKQWCVGKTYWLKGCLYKSGELIYEAEIEGEDKDEN